LGNCLAVLSEGRVRQLGSPAAVVARPEHRHVAEYLGIPPMNFVHGAWAASGSGLRFAAADGTIHLPMPAELVTHGAGGQPVTVGIRPEDLTPANSAASVPPDNDCVSVDGWTVQLFERLSGRRLITLALGGWTWSCWEPEGAGSSLGDLLSLRFRLDRCHWFAADGSRLCI